MKKRMIAILSGVIILGVLMLSIQIKYPVKADSSNLLGQVQKVLKQLEVDYQSVQLEKVIDLEKHKYAIVTIDNYLGSVNLSKGINGRYGIRELIYGQSAFKFILDKQEKETQLVIVGHNINTRINKMTFKIADDSYEVQIPAEEYFMVHFVIEELEIPVTPSEIKLYDMAGEEITQMFYKDIVK